MRARFAGPSLFLVIVLASNGCAVGKGPDRPPEARPRELAATPSTDRASPSSRPNTAAPEGTARAEPAAPAATAKASSSARFREVAEIRDEAGDVLPVTPGYADLTRVSMASDSRSLRVTVDVHESLPQQLKTGEVIGIGVDIEDYQVFADGGSDGWFAFFHTPKGFIQYPGTFAVEGRRVTFEVPWSAIDDRRGRASSFLDWSRRTAVVAEAEEDYAPDKGTVPFDARAN